jgi:hypothetical protein
MLAWLCEHDPLPVVAWHDAVMESPGFDARSDYVEMFWVPVLGPSCVLAVRRLAGWLELYPDGFELPLEPFARSVGLGGGTGRHAPMIRTLARLVDFAIATITGDTYALRTTLPALSARQVARLPEFLAVQHAGESRAVAFPSRR